MRLGIAMLLCVASTVGAQTTQITIDPGMTQAQVIQKLAASPAAMADLSVSNEGTVLGPFATDRGAFQVNWTFVYNN